MDMEGIFVQRLVYDDSVSYDLVSAAEKVLGKYCTLFDSVGNTGSAHVHFESCTALMVYAILQNSAN